MLTDKTTAVVFEEPEKLAIRELELRPAAPDDCVVDIEWSGISTGTERLLWSGRMPQFPGMGYPLVPGYESVGRIVATPADCELNVGERVFVPGAQCFTDARGLFGGAASRLLVPAERLVPLGDSIGAEGALMALSATAYHALMLSADELPGLVVGHGVLGRLLARLIIALGGNVPTVWDSQSERRAGAIDYSVVHPDDDERRDYRVICDVSGDADILDSLIQRLAPGGTIVLAGFYHQPLHFGFPAAFMREARLQVAAEWQAADLDAVLGLIKTNRLSLDGLLTHHANVQHAAEAYQTAFTDSTCLKMIIDWRH